MTIADSIATASLLQQYQLCAQRNRAVIKAIIARTRKDRAAAEPAPPSSVGVGEGVREGSGMTVVEMTGAVEAANRNWKEPEESEV